MPHTTDTQTVKTLLKEDTIHMDRFRGGRHLVWICFDPLTKFSESVHVLCTTDRRVQQSAVHIWSFQISRKIKRIRFWPSFETVSLN